MPAPMHIERQQQPVSSSACQVYEDTLRRREQRLLDISSGVHQLAVQKTSRRECRSYTILKQFYFSLKYFNSFTFSCLFLSS